MSHLLTLLFALSLCCALGATNLWAAQPRAPRPPIELPMPPTHAPPQLNIEGFASCLAQATPKFDLTRERSEFSLKDSDLLLLYLSLYPGKRLPAPISLLQDRAYARWAAAFESREHLLASLLREHLSDGQASISPARFFGDALSACGQSVFCAALISHNVLRTLGRHEKAVYRSLWTGLLHDLNPRWFLDDQDEWIEQIPYLQKMLINVRPDFRGDGWGEWYHFFGILTYTAHELALREGIAPVELVVRLNELLNPILAGGAEGDEKARLDQDSVQTSWRFLRGLGIRHQDLCDDRSAYVAQ